MAHKTWDTFYFLMPSHMYSPKYTIDILTKTNSWCFAKITHCDEAETFPGLTFPLLHCSYDGTDRGLTGF